MMVLDPLATLGNNSLVLFNSGDEFGDSNIQADSRLLRHFLRPSNTTGTSISMAGRGGDTFGYAGACMPVRQPYHVPATSVWRRKAGLKLIQEATMPSFTLRTIRAHSPSTHTISIAATMAEAQIIARMHLARTGHSVRIAPAACGFSVAEVR